MDDLCYCDYEYPDVYRSESRKALIRHRCCACGRDIRPKETYEYVGVSGTELGLSTRPAVTA